MIKETEHIWMDFEDKLRAFIFSKVQVKEVADDILQEVFIKIHCRIDTLNDETKFQPWIFQITRNQIADYYRSKGKERNQNQFLEETEEENSDQSLLEEALNDMIKMMEDLPAEYCEALCMTELEGLSQVEYAKKIGISYTGAKSRVQRARKMLKDLLMNCCHYEFDKYGTVLNISPNNCCCCHPFKLP